MVRKFMGSLAIVLAVLLVGPTLLLAATDVEEVSGKIEAVDLNAGTLTIEVNEDEDKEVKAPKEMLAGLKPGDTVSIKVQEGTAISIEKNDEDS